MTDPTAFSDVSGPRSPPPARRPTQVLVQEALARNPNDPDALFVLAAMRTRDGRLDEGLSILNHMLGVDPTYPGAWFFKEKLHRLRGEPDDAEQARRKGEASEP